MAHTDSTDTATSPAPPIAEWDDWQRARDALLHDEKAHTRAGDVIAAARRRLPMAEVPPVQLEGANGAVSLLDVFDGREQLVVYKHMWHAGQPFEGQCEGCTITHWSFKDADDAIYLNEQGISFAVFADGPWSELAPFREFMGYTAPWYSTHGSADPFWETDGTITCLLRQGDRVFVTYETTGRGVESIMGSLQLLDLTAFGRKERWEDSPEGWPQQRQGQFWRRDGRPTAQWTRPGVGAVDEHAGHHHH